MAKLAVLASGNGSNFQSITEKLQQSGRHKVCCLICDRKNALVFERAAEMGIPSYHISYVNRNRELCETEIDVILNNTCADLVALAGYMRLLSPWILNRWPMKIVNIHPSLLPLFPGIHGIQESYESKEKELGITIHYVDNGMDTGPIITQESFLRNNAEDIEIVEKKIHQLEHAVYPEILTDLLDTIDSTSGGSII